MAGPKKNQNALKHGLYSAQRKTLSPYGRKRLGHFRKAIVARAQQALGTIDLTKSCLLHTAIEAHRVAIENRELRARHAATLTVDQTLAIDRAYLQALGRRDETLLALELDKPVDPWAVLDSLPLAPPAGPPAAPAPVDVQAGGPGHAGAAQAQEGAQ